MKLKIDRIQAELLRALRGKRTQGQLNRKLGFRYNQVYRWESGLNRIHWTEFVSFCGACGVDASESLRRLLNTGEKLEEGEKLLRALVGEGGLSAAGRSFGVSRFVLSNWLRGKSKVPLDAVLTHLAGRSMLVKYAGSLVDAELLPSLKGTLMRDRLQRELRYRTPWSTVLAMCFGLEEYRALPAHRPGFAGKMIGLSEEEEERLVARLLEAGMIERKAGKYAPVVGVFDIRGDFEGERQAKVHWIQAGLRRFQALPKPSDTEVFGNFIFELSDPAHLLLRQAYTEFHQKLQAVWEQDKDQSKRIRILNIQLFDCAPA